MYIESTRSTSGRAIALDGMQLTFHFSMYVISDGCYLWVLQIQCFTYLWMYEATTINRKAIQENQTQQ